MELRHPHLLPAAAVLGAEIIKEFEGEQGFILFRLLRAVVSWSYDGMHGLDTAILSRTEHALLAEPAGPFSSPAGLLAGYMASPADAPRDDVAWCCVCLSDWAAEQRAKATARLFAQAAAYAHPSHAPYAWLAAALLAAAGRPHTADAWLARSWRVAVWANDRVAQYRTLVMRARISEEQGNRRRKERLEKAARRLAEHYWAVRELHE